MLPLRDLVGDFGVCQIQSRCGHKHGMLYIIIRWTETFELNGTAVGGSTVIVWPLPLVKSRSKIRIDGGTSVIFAPQRRKFKSTVLLDLVSRCGLSSIVSKPMQT